MKIKDICKIPELSESFCSIHIEVNDSCAICTYSKVRNETIEEIGNMEISTMDVEELAKFLWDYQQRFLYGKEALSWKRALELDKGGMGISEYRERAKAICAKFPTPSKPVSFDEEAIAEISDCIAHYVDEPTDVKKIINFMLRFAKPVKEELDEKFLIKCIEDFYNNNWSEDLRTKKLAQEICAKFSIPTKPEVQDREKLIEDFQPLVGGQREYAERAADYFIRFSPTVSIPSVVSIEDVISYSDLWKNCLTRTGLQKDKRHLAQAIRNLLTERSGK